MEGNGAFRREEQERHLKLEIRLKETVLGKVCEEKD